MLLIPPEHALQRIYSHVQAVRIVWVLSLEEKNTALQREIRREFIARHQIVSKQGTSVWWKSSLTNVIVFCLIIYSLLNSNSYCILKCALSMLQVLSFEISMKSVSFVHTANTNEPYILTWFVFALKYIICKISHTKFVFHTHFIHTYEICLYVKFYLFKILKMYKL